MNSTVHSDYVSCNVSINTHLTNFWTRIYITVKQSNTEKYVARAIEGA